MVLVEYILFILLNIELPSQEYEPLLGSFFCKSAKVISHLGIQFTRDLYSQVSRRRGPFLLVFVFF